MGRGWILVLLVTFLSACGGRSANLPTPTVEPGSATPWLEPSHSPSPTVTGSSTPTPTFMNLPTPTPILYTVVLNDNLISIARNFNITLEELLAANPTIGTQALAVGTVLTIPSGRDNSSPPTTTPMPVDLQQVQCFPNLDGSLYCLILVKNDHSEVLQNLFVLINLLDSKGMILKSQIAYAPMDILRPDAAMPIGVLFAEPVPQGYQPQARLLGATRAGSVGTLYPALDLLSSLVTVDWGGLNAHIIGKAKLSVPDVQASRVWILGVAYDLVGNVIGFNRWESNATLKSADNLSFEFMVASLGPKIDHVDLILEAVK